MRRSSRATSRPSRSSRRSRRSCATSTWRTRLSPSPTAAHAAAECEGGTVCMAHFYMHRLRSRLAWVPADGERVQLVEIGNHCRGAVFYDGSWIITPELEAIIDRISRSYPGFYFGRFDVRTPSLDD